MISIDGEWGLGMRYPKKSISFPRALTLGAIQEVINNRSFGEDKYNVAAKSYAYMQGMQENGVLACAKHFPGHGDTDTDSHHDLPIINHNRARLDSVELMPFRSLIKQGIGSVMVAHLNIPAFDDRPNRPTTLSHNAITNVLRKELEFDGVVFTDAMEMKGVTKHFAPGDADKEAFLAGNDVILLPENLEAGFKSIKAGILDGSIPRSRLEESVKRILKAKHELNLTNWRPIPISNISTDINNNQSLALKEKLLENAITLVSDEDNIVPIKKLNDMKFSTIAIGSKFKTPLICKEEFRYSTSELRVSQKT